MAIHSVFDPESGNPGEVVRLADAGDVITLGTGFYLFGAADAWYCVGGKVFVPDAAGVSEIEIGLYEIDPPDQPPNLATQSPVRTATISPVVTGWNEAAWAPYEMSTGDPVWVVYTTGGVIYYADGDLTPDPVVAHDGSQLAMSEGAGSPPYRRSVFRIGSDPTAGGGPAVYYGADIIVNDSAEAPVPTGSAETVVLDLTVTASGSAPTPTVPAGAAETATLGLSVSASGSAPTPSVPTGAAETVTLGLTVSASGSAPSPSVPVGAAVTVTLGLTASASGRPPGGSYTDGPTLAEFLDLAKSITILEDDDMDGSKHPPLYEYHTKVGNTDTIRILASDPLEPASSVKVIIGREEGTPIEKTADEVDGQIATVTLTATETATVGDRSLELQADWPGDGGVTRYPGRGALRLYVHE